MGDPDRGIYVKFRITRTDGTSKPGRKHHLCPYFVLDLRHDPHAYPALRAYADSCRATLPKLAADIDKIIAESTVGLASAAVEAEALMRDG